MVASGLSTHTLNITQCKEDQAAEGNISTAHKNRHGELLMCCKSTNQMRAPLLEIRAAHQTLFSCTRISANPCQTEEF